MNTSTKDRITQKIKIINNSRNLKIVQLIDYVNINSFGVVNSALSSSEYLYKEYGITTELWTKEIKDVDIENIFPFVIIRLIKNKNLFSIYHIVRSNEYNFDKTIFITNGCWRFSSRWGYIFHILGYKWISVPHGMLEEWAMSSKGIRKWVYFNLIESHLLNTADIIKAVSPKEGKSLSKIFKNKKIVFINNFINPTIYKEKIFDNEHITVLYLSRLHAIKGILELTKAWYHSKLSNNEKYNLIIAGPDEGQLTHLNNYLAVNQVANIKYIGTIFGDKKKKLLEESAYFILPSYSEGLPVSVLEAMQAGNVCLITKECNFTNAFKKNAAIEIKNNIEDLTESLNKLDMLTSEEYYTISRNAKKYILDEFSVDASINKEIALYNELFN